MTVGFIPMPLKEPVFILLTLLGAAAAHLHDIGSIRIAAGYEYVLAKSNQKESVIHPP
ncbi:MAG TPA: hypothetical protein VFS81_27245 [Candidatus Binatia bacterium]|nr:hypothetical protein [Candidatus Binatia bacterium]